MRYAPGFVLARDVEDSDGYKLLKMGTVLSNSQISLLVGWKVAEVWVEDAKAPLEVPAKSVPGPAAAAAGPVFDAARESLKKRFEGRLVNPWIKALYAEAEKRIGAARSFH